MGINPYCRSLKRRRSWLEIGFAGCAMLGNPVQGAWPSFGTVWSSLEHSNTPPSRASPLQARHQSGNNHHGTQESPSRSTPSSLRGSTSTSHTPPPSRARRLSLDSSDNHDPVRRGLGEPAVEVEIALQVQTGDWEACSPKTCTQTRVVFCLTREHRVVASDVCSDALGDALPEAERACGPDDIAAVCGDTAAAAAASSAGAVGWDPESKSVVEGGGSRPSAFSSNANDGGNVGASGGPGAKSKGSAPLAPSATTPSGSGNNSNSKGYQPGSKPAATTEKDKRKPATKVPAPAPLARGATAPKTASFEGNDEAAGAEEEEQGDAGGVEADSTIPAASSRTQGQTPGNGKSPSPSFAASGGQMDQMGAAGPRAHRLEYRFWIVMAIGAGAVGSFLAVVLFAVGQYRKEQHRLRGIMALNEFPQDNYINPFAKQLSSDLSEHDRSAFKL